MPKAKGPERLIVSLHIPKTGGTSFSDVLERAYPGQVAFFYQANNRLTHAKLKDHARLRDPDVLREIEEDGIRVIHGHAPAGWFLRNIADQGRFWTWLRDPAERVISAYYYLVQRGQRMPDQPGAAKVVGRTLEDYARVEKNQNIQSRVLAGMDLSQMGFVGVTERFDESLAMLGLTQHQLPKPRNRNRKKPEVDPELRALIAELNAADVALYEEAVRLLEARLAARDTAA